MAKPRPDTVREIYGLLGRFTNRAQLLQSWNKYLLEEGSGGSMVHYPTTAQTLPERLSEMFHFDRRLYVVDPALQFEVMKFLDEVSTEAKKQGRVNLIRNRGGVLQGHYVDTPEHPENALRLLTTAR